MIVTDRLPSEGHHGWKVLEFGPDGLLYLPVGAPCDVCRTEGYHGTILRMRRDGSGIEIYARGLRNSVGLAWHPETGELWFTDNGSDHLGPDLPPDELNRAPGPGLHYGFPFCHAGTLPDPGFGGDGRCADTEPPAQALAAHVAPLGLAIHSGTNVPQAYRGAVFIAEHGPGNRRGTIGYRVSVVRLSRRSQDRVGLHGICPGVVRQRAGVGTAGRHPGGSRTAQSWSRTIGPGESTGSGTSVGRRPPIPPNARQGQARWLRLLDLNLALSVNRLPAYP